MRNVIKYLGLLLVASLESTAGCGLDAPIVRLPRPIDTAGTAGQFSTAFAGQASGGDVGGNGAATGGWRNSDPYSTNRYDWCLPPIYDPMQVPSYPVCDFPIQMRTPWRWSATILLDRAMSMGNPLPGSKTSKWVGVRNALSLMADEPTGFLDQWSLMAFANVDELDASQNCDLASYTASAPAAQTLPRINVAAIQAAFDGLTPSAKMRPTAAALEAAIADAQRNAEPLKGASTPIVILITDGLPFGCSAGTELDSLAKVVAAVNSPTAINYTPVYVVQLGDHFDLNPVAAAGKTDQAFVISGGEIDRQLVKILRRILYPQPTPCDAWYGIPKSNAKGASHLDFDIRMESAYTNSVLYPPHLESAEDCEKSPAGGFWVTDKGESQPFLVGLCPCTCAAMGTDRYTTLTMYCGK